MLEVRVTRKFHDQKGILVGYTVKDINTGETMNVYKDSLKKAAMEGSVRIENMTLTSDGRLIGRASEKPAVKRQEWEVITLYNLGKDIIGMIIGDRYSGKKTFKFGADAMESINNGSVKLIEASKKKPFKSVFEKTYKALTEQLGENKLNIQVEKTGKDEYRIEWNKASITSELAYAYIHMCIEYSMRIAKIKVPEHFENGVIVKSLTGMTDVRKAIKAAKLDRL